ncbi:MAG: hypothetical protein V3T72_08435 [Thermoanaerobaculia bacterium]
MDKPFTKLGSFVFALVAAGHLLRAGLGWDFVIGGMAVPLSASVVAAIIAGGLSWMMLQEARSLSRPG